MRPLAVQVTVRYPQGRAPLVNYRQAFTGPTTRLCLNCFSVVAGAAAPAAAVLEGGLDLFCSLDCERLYYMKNSSSERGLQRLGRLDQHSKLCMQISCCKAQVDACT